MRALVSTCPDVEDNLRLAISTADSTADSTAVVALMRASAASNDGGDRIAAVAAELRSAACDQPSNHLPNRPISALHA
eukprot:6209000-Pleurochrysis_carterae.AAC.1